MASRTALIVALLLVGTLLLIDDADAKSVKKPNKGKKGDKTKTTIPEEEEEDEDNSEPDEGGAYYRQKRFTGDFVDEENDSEPVGEPQFRQGKFINIRDDSDGTDGEEPIRKGKIIDLGNLLKNDRDNYPYAGSYGGINVPSYPAGPYAPGGYYGSRLGYGDMGYDEEYYVTLTKPKLFSLLNRFARRGDDTDYGYYGKRRTEYYDSQEGTGGSRRKTGFIYRPRPYDRYSSSHYRY